MRPILYDIRSVQAFQRYRPRLPPQIRAIGSTIWIGRRYVTYDPDRAQWRRYVIGAIALGAFFAWLVL